MTAKAPGKPARQGTIEFQVRGPHIALNDLLKLAGVCDSGGAGKMLVAAKEVLVDGVIETRKTCKIRPGQQVRWGSFTIAVAAAPEGGDVRGSPESLDAGMPTPLVS